MGFPKKRLLQILFHTSHVRILMHPVIKCSILWLVLLTLSRLPGDDVVEISAVQLSEEEEDGKHDLDKNRERTEEEAGRRRKVCLTFWMKKGR